MIPYLIILHDTRLDDAVELAERTRSAIQKLGIEHKSSGCSDVVTASIGVAATDQTELTDSYTSLVLAADEALYVAKKDVWNQVKAARQTALTELS